MNNIPVIVIITSATCGHCINMRGDGSFKPEDSPPTIKRDETVGKKSGGWAWTESFFRKLLRGGADSGSVNIIEFSEFELDTFKNEVSRSTFYSQNDKLMNTFVIGYRKNPPEPTEITDRTYSQYLRQCIPTQISNYCYAYPSWFYCAGNNWYSSITDNTPLYGYLASMQVVKLNNGQYGVDKNSLGLIEDPVSTAEKISSKKINLTPPNNLKSDINQPPVTPGFILLPHT
jgi:hypothetical protein